MFFILSKALLFLLSPFFWILLGVLVYFFRKKEDKWKKRIKWTVIGLFFFFSNSVLFSEFCRMWEVPGSRTEQVGEYEVGIVLGGMFEYDGDLNRLSIRRQGDRFVQAVTLYKTGKIKKILISGDSGFVTDRGLHEAKQIKSLLLKWGIPEEDIITEGKSRNTHENAKFTVELLKQEGFSGRNCLLITSGIHMKRALGCFEREGLTCVPFSTDLYTNRTRNYYWDQYIIPNTDNLRLWAKLFKEIVGYVTYDVRGYI